jgi:two-component system sensor histidine kinase KdpD
LGHLALRLLLSAGGVASVTFVAHKVIPGNPTTVAFAYLLFVLIVASTWGFVEACLSSVLATLAFNFFFLPPVGTFTIADPQNWVALFSFLATSLIASRLSDKAKQKARYAVERQQDVERLYTFSRAILLLDSNASLPKQLVQKLVEVFGLSAAILYDRRSGEVYRAGPSEFEGMHEQLREAALNGTTFSDAEPLPWRGEPVKPQLVSGQGRPGRKPLADGRGSERHWIITAVRLGAEPIASLALQGAQMPDSVLQGIATLIAIGLERARAQDLTHQVEAARQSERLRTTLIDAMAHEFKTPLTSIKAATTSLLADPNQPLDSRTELLKIADEESDHLQDLVDNAADMARLDIAQIDIQPELSDVGQIVREVVASMRVGIDDRQVAIASENPLPPVALDRRLMKLAIKQLVDNSLKYSPQDTPVTVQVLRAGEGVTLEVTNHGAAIPLEEQSRIFERFYRSPSVERQIPGSGLGLSIAHRIARAHHGDLTLTSGPGETTFRMTLPIDHKGSRR